LKKLCKGRQKVSEIKTMTSKTLHFPATGGCFTPYKVAALQGGNLV
jgi:hypothetical protein